MGNDTYEAEPVYIWMVHDVFRDIPTGHPF